ncbi:MAG: hypothetical protein MJ200_04430 [Mycoplasmoidaceae bacterium]|nr:hypothetical protein [Mycoplasmoidaceae bacterium]
MVQSITDSYGVLCIETIREASDLKTNVIMTENEAGNSTLSLCSFVRGSVYNSECDFKFKSDSPLLKDSNPTIGFDSSILYFDGISSEIIKLE